MTVCSDPEGATRLHSHRADSAFAKNNVLILLTHFGRLGDIIRNYVGMCDTLLETLISLIIY